MTSKTYRFDAYHVLPDSPQMQKDFLYVVASLKAKSSEPMAEDVLRIAKLNNILPVDVEGFQEYPGRGLGGLITLPDEQRPRAVIMGTREFIEQCGLEIPAILEVTARKWESAPDSMIMLVGWDGWVRGILKFIVASSATKSLADPPKP
jgi:cation transport ATPase